MIEGSKYIELVKLFFSFLVTEFDFCHTSQKENGNAFYDVEYSNSEKSISISYENIQDHLQVIVFYLKNGQLPDYDDKSRTFHLNELNRTIYSRIDKTEIENNAILFSQFNPNDDLERRLLKSAKELRLVMKYWADSGE